MAYKCPDCGEKTLKKVHDPFKEYIWECDNCGGIPSNRVNV